METPSNSPKAALTVKQAAAELSLGRNKMYELVRMPGFPAIKIGNKIVIPRQGLERWLQENEGRAL